MEGVRVTLKNGREIIIDPVRMLTVWDGFKDRQILGDQIESIEGYVVDPEYLPDRCKVEELTNWDGARRLTKKREE